MNSITAPAISTRRRFLSQAAGVAAGGTALALATISATADAAAPVASLATSGVDPVFDPIERHRKARRALRDAEAAHSLAEKEMHADGSLFPRTVSTGNPYSGLPRPVSTSHADIDRYTPADLFPQDNKREHEEMSGAISLRDARIGPIEEAMNDAAIAEREIVEELVETEPTTIAGVLALLRFQRIGATLQCLRASSRKSPRMLTLSSKLLRSFWIRLWRRLRLMRRRGRQTFCY
jgi:hypothetical protein